jgi:hypothetical protein
MPDKSTHKHSHQKIDPNVLLYKTDGTSALLTASRLEQWFAKAYSAKFAPKPTPGATEANSPELALRLTSMYGMKDATQVIRFLKSHEGQAVVSLLQRQWAEEIELEDEGIAQAREEHAERRNRLCFLILGLLHRNEARAEQREHESVEATTKHLRQEADAIKQQHDKLMAMENTRRQFQAYDESVRLLDSALTSKMSEATGIEEALRKLDEDIARGTKEYGFFEEALDTIYQELDDLGSALENSVDAIKQRMDDLAGDIQRNIDLVQDYLSEGKDDEARGLMAATNACNAQMGVMHDMLNVISGKKMLFTAEGEQTKDLQQAEYILPAEMKLAKDDRGNYYLLGPGQELDKLTNEEKVERAQLYLKMRPEILGVKQLVRHNRHSEEMSLRENRSLLTSRSEIMQQEILLLVNQLSQVQAQRAEMGARLKPYSPSMSSLPVPTPSVSKAQSKEHVTNGYRHVVLLMQRNLTERSIDWLKGNVSDPSIQAQLKALRPGQKMPEPLLRQILKQPNLERFRTTFNATNLSMLRQASSPLPPRALLDERPEERPERRPSPSPFKPRG